MSDEITTTLRAAAAWVPPSEHGFEAAVARGRRLRRRDLAVRMAVLPVVAALLVLASSIARPRPEHVDLVDHPTTTSTAAEASATPGGGPHATGSGEGLATTDDRAPGAPSAVPGRARTEVLSTRPAVEVAAMVGEDVVAMRPDGTGRRRLATRRGTLLAWSPDRRTLLFGGNEGLVAVDVAGDTARTLVPGVYAASADYSPDGTRIAYWTIDFELDPFDERPEHHLWVIDADGTHGHEVPGNGQQPVWSPDGQRILYVGCGEGAGALCTVRPDGTGHTTLRAPQLVSPRWTVDGTALIGSGEGGLLMVHPDGTGRRMLVSGVNAAQLAVTTDGRFVVYSAYNRLYRVDVTGGEPVEFLAGASSPVAPWPR